MRIYDRPRLVGLRDWMNSPGAHFYYGNYARETECGTTLCLAGKAVVDAGAKLAWITSIRSLPNKSATHCRAGDGLVHIEDYAAELCGLTPEEGELLFSAEVGSVYDNERCARDFLDHLIDRAANGLPSMTDQEVANWEVKWKSAKLSD